jgi:hypothetical protein
MDEWSVPEGRDIDNKTRGTRVRERAAIEPSRRRGSLVTFLMWIDTTHEKLGHPTDLQLLQKHSTE